MGGYSHWLHFSRIFQRTDGENRFYEFYTTEKEAGFCFLRLGLRIDCRVSYEARVDDTVCEKVRSMDYGVYEFLTQEFVLANLKRV